MASPTLTQRDSGPALALTTTFVPPPRCTEGHLTMLGRQSYYIWQNEPLPVVGTTIGECYPKEFMTGYLDAFRGNTRPAFSPLVCPQNYQTMSSKDLGKDSPYIVCCPNNYGFAPPAAPNPNRPGAGGTCYSDILNTMVTKYDQESLQGLIFFSTSGQAYAHPFDGFAYQGNQIATAAPPAVVNPQPSLASSNSQPATNIQSAPTSSPDSPSAPAVSSRLPSTAAPSAIAIFTLPSSVVAVSTIASSVVLFSTIPPSIITVYNSNTNNIPQSTVDPPSSQSTSPSTAATTGLSLSSSASPPSPSRSPTLTSGQMAGMITGIVLGIAILVSALLFFTRHRRRKPIDPIRSQLEVPQLEDTHIRNPAKIIPTNGRSSGAASSLEKNPNYLPSRDVASRHYEMATCREVPERFEMGSYGK